MAKREGHIYVYGAIGSNLPAQLGAAATVTLRDVQQQYHRLGSDVERLVVHIHSPGGDVHEGFAIHDFLVGTGKPVRTRIEGLCASIATVIALAGAEREMTANSDFFIHNPWGLADGDADDIRRYADQLKGMEQRLAAFYHAKTGIGTPQLNRLMKQQTTLDAQQALSMGFITRIAEPVQAVAFLNINHNNKKHDMSEHKNEVRELRGWWSKVKGRLGMGLLNLDLTLADGTPITVETEAEAPAVGDALTIDGQPAPDGEYTLVDGSVIVAEEGVITDIVTPEDDAAEAGDYKALYNSIKAKYTELLAAKREQDKIVADMRSTLAMVRSGWKAPRRKQTFNQLPADTNKVDEAKQRRQLYKQN